MWGTFRAGVGCSLYSSRFLFNLPGFSEAFCRTPIEIKNIPIIKFPANRWNASHQPESISLVHKYFLPSCSTLLTSSSSLLFVLAPYSIFIFISLKEIEAREVICSLVSKLHRMYNWARWVQAGRETQPNPSSAPVPSAAQAASEPTTPCSILHSLP